MVFSAGKSNANIRTSPSKQNRINVDFACIMIGRMTGLNKLLHFSSSPREIVSMFVLTA